MKKTLRISGKEAELRDFIPHKVVVHANEALYRGVQIKSNAMTATKEELQSEFGIETIKAMDAMEPSAYEKRLADLREEFLRRRVEMEGLTLGNVEEANIRKVTGVTLKIGTDDATRELIENLPHEDFETLLECYDQISESTASKKKSAPQEN